MFLKIKIIFCRELLVENVFLYGFKLWPRDRGLTPWCKIVIILQRRFMTPECRLRRSLIVVIDTPALLLHSYRDRGVIASRFFFNAMSSVLCSFIFWVYTGDSLQLYIIYLIGRRLMSGTLFEFCKKVCQNDTKGNFSHLKKVIKLARFLQVALKSANFASACPYFCILLAPKVQILHFFQLSVFFSVKSYARIVPELTVL